MGNVCCLTNKFEELESLVRYQKLYRESSIVCLTETWLTENTPDSLISFTGFKTIRADRDTGASGKQKGGGLLLLVNNKWCNPNHATVKEQICNKDIELLAVSLRPYYLPREFTVVITIAVYIPPSAKAEVACDELHTTIARLQSKFPEAFIVVSGDFNHVCLSKTLPTFKQFIDCATRGGKTLDLLYANVKNAYKCTALPPLGRSDHDMLHLSPSYTPAVKRLPVTTRTSRVWHPEADEALRCCFETTDWDVFCEDYGEDIDGLTECITNYINFCYDDIMPSRVIRCFPNNKPWITSSLKSLLNEKKKAFREGDRNKIKELQKELKVRIKEGKEAFRLKLEQQLQQDGVKQVWAGMRKITGMKQKGSTLPDGELSLADDLNRFFNRFDCPTPPLPPLPGLLTNAASSPPPLPLSNTPEMLPAQSPLFSPPTPPATPPMTFHTAQVKMMLYRLKPGKAVGPDDISPRLLKTCSSELCGILTHLFNLSLRLQKVPRLWKTSCLVPVPKKTHPTNHNDYRPVALTSHIMKTFERLVLSSLCTSVSTQMDPLQFAYQPNISVDDALIYMLQRAYTHLDTPDASVRITFFDFSSAFNTIQPRLLGEKMEMMKVDPLLVLWCLDYLYLRPQYVRLQNNISCTILSSTGAPQGTVLAPFLFTIYTADYKYNTKSCFLQKYSDDTAVVGLIKGGNEEEYRDTIDNFMEWSTHNNLHLNTTKTKEIVVDFRRGRRRTQPTPISIGGTMVEMVANHRYLGVQLDSELDWKSHMEAVYKKGQSRLFFLRRLRSFNICQPLLCTVYHTVVASALFFAVACWGEGACTADKKRLDKLIRKASSVVGAEQLKVQQVAEARILNKLASIMSNPTHPLHALKVIKNSTFSQRLIAPICKTERYRKSCIPAAIRFYNAQN